MCRKRALGTLKGTDREGTMWSTEEHLAALAWFPDWVEKLQSSHSGLLAYGAYVVFEKSIRH